MDLERNDKNYLWQLFKPLIDSDNIKIYVDKMDSEAKTIPQDYALVIRSTYDTPLQFGDSKVLVRDNDFNIYIYSGDSDKALEMARLFENIMDDSGINYSRYGPTPDPNTNRFSILIIGNYHYGK